jgi:hypothetical protein
MMPATPTPARAGWSAALQPVTQPNCEHHQVFRGDAFEAPGTENPSSSIPESFLAYAGLKGHDEGRQIMLEDWDLP